jgi:site-specific DNA recombinase
MHVIQNTHDPIISRETFDAVQNLMKQRKKFITAPKLHLFTNILFCADCGKGMWFRSNRRNGYICGNYARHGKKACSAHTIRENILKETILHDLRTLVQEIDKEQFSKDLEVKSKKSKKDTQQKLDKLNKQIDILKKRKKNFINMLADEKIEHSEYLEMVEEKTKILLSLQKRKM